MVWRASVASWLIIRLASLQSQCSLANWFATGRYSPAQSGCQSFGCPLNAVRRQSATRHRQVGCLSFGNQRQVLCRGVATPPARKLSPQSWLRHHCLAPSRYAGVIRCTAPAVSNTSQTGGTLPALNAAQACSQAAAFAGQPNGALHADASTFHACGVARRGALQPSASGAGELWR